MKLRIALTLRILCFLTSISLVGCATSPPVFPYDTSPAGRARYANSASQVHDEIEKGALKSKQLLLSISATSPSRIPYELPIAADEFRNTLGNAYSVVLYGAYRNPSDKLFTGLNLSNGEVIHAMEEIVSLTHGQTFTIVALDKDAFVQCAESIRFARRNGVRMDADSIFAINIDPDVVSSYRDIGVRIIALQIK